MQGLIVEDRRPKVLVFYLLSNKTWVLYPFTISPWLAYLLRLDHETLPPMTRPYVFYLK